MRLTILYILLCIVFLIPERLSGQHYTIKEFNRHLPAGKSTVDSVFIVQTEYPATGIILRVEEKENFTGSFMVVKLDTLYFTEGEERGAEDHKKFSNLLTFSSPVPSFLFCPGRIKGDIQFYYINAQNKDEGLPVKPSKKKRFRLCRTRHD